MANGYVYILTNPSFREDWVKIGKTSRPVNTRSKELDNTAVPLPFEIYATLKTEEYDKAEKLIHKMIDRLTDKRIRKSREFFNIEPKIALQILQDVQEVIGGEITLGAKDESKEPETKVELPHDGVLKCTGSGADATAVKEGEGLKVLKGSKVSKTLAESFKKHNYYKYRIQLEKEGVISRRLFTQDYTFSSYSATAAVVLGRSANGKTEWKTAAK